MMRGQAEHGGVLPGIDKILSHTDAGRGACDRDLPHG